LDIQDTEGIEIDRSKETVSEFISKPGPCRGAQPTNGVG